MREGEREGGKEEGREGDVELGNWNEIVLRFVPLSHSFIQVRI